MLTLAPLAATAVLAQSLPAIAGTATPAPSRTNMAAAVLPAGIPAPGSRADNNLTSWINQVEVAPNKFDQNLEALCVEHGGAACSLSYAQIKRLPGEIEAMTKNLVEAVQGDKALNDEVTSDFTPGSQSQGGPEQTRAVGPLIRATQGVKALISAAPKNKALQKLAANADKIGDVADNVSRLAYAQLGVQGGTAAMIAKVAIYSTPILGDIFSLGEAIFDSKSTTAERVEGGVCATLSLIAATAAFAGGPVGAAAGVTIAVALAAYYAGKAVWGWLAGGSQDWTVPPTAPEELYKAGAYFDWEAHTVTATVTTSFRGSVKKRLAKLNVAMVIPATGRDRTSTVSETLLVDSRWTDYNKHGKPVAYKFIPYGSYNVPQGLYLRNWGAKNATVTVAQDGAVKSGTCSGPYRGHGQDPLFFQCGPASTVRISNGHPAVVKVTYTYTLPTESESAPTIRPIGASLSVYTPKNDKVTLDLPFQVAFVAKDDDPAAVGS